MTAAALIVAVMTTTTAPPEAPLPVDIRPVPPTPVPALDVVVPVFNEEAGLESCLRRLHAHLATEFPYRFRITVADNASPTARWPSRTGSRPSCRA